MDSLGYHNLILKSNFKTIEEIKALDLGKKSSKTSKKNYPKQKLSNKETNLAIQEENQTVDINNRRPRRTRQERKKHAQIQKLNINLDEESEDIPTPLFWNQIPEPEPELIASDHEYVPEIQRNQVENMKRSEPLHDNKIKVNNLSYKIQKDTNKLK